MANRRIDQHQPAKTANRHSEEAVRSACKKIDKLLGYLVSNVGEGRVTTTINVTFENETFNRLENAKEELDLTWQQLVIRGTESLVEKNDIVTEVN